MIKIIKKLGHLVDSADSKREAFVWGFALASLWVSFLTVISSIIQIYE